MTSNHIGRSYDYRAICDVCGFKKWNYELRKRWDGLMCCAEDWEPRNFLDFYRTRNDAHRLPFTRPDGSASGAESQLTAASFGVAFQTPQYAFTGSIPYIVTAYPITVELMVLSRNRPSVGSAQSFCRFASGHLIFRFENTGQLRFLFQNSATSFRSFQSATITNSTSGNVPLNRWMRLSASVVSDTSATLQLDYLNSTGTITTVTDSTPTTGSAGTYIAGPGIFYLGSDPFGDMSVDIVDDLRIWSVVRTSTQITKDWNSIITPTTANLVANYRQPVGYIANSPNPKVDDLVVPGTRPLTLQGATYFPHMMQYSQM